MRKYMILLSVAMLGTLAVFGQSTMYDYANCGQWNTDPKAFFRTATAGQVKACLAIGANPNSVHDVKFYEGGFGKRKYTMRPLRLAIRLNRDEEIVRTLIEAGADTSGWPDWSFVHESVSPLSIDTESECKTKPGIIKLLLGAGVDPDLRDSRGNTALHLAAAYRGGKCGESIVRALLEGGADPNITDRKGRTALELGPSKRVSRVILAGGGTRSSKSTRGSSDGSGLFGAILSATEAVAADYEATSASIDEAMRQDAERAAGQEERARRERERLEEDRRRAARDSASRARRKAEVLDGDCCCISINDKGEYTCMDGFVSARDSVKPLCDIRRCRND